MYSRNWFKIMWLIVGWLLMKLYAKGGGFIGFN